MVDVGDKDKSTERTAIAEGRITMARDTLRLIADGTAPKGRRHCNGPHRRYHGREAHP